MPKSPKSDIFMTESAIPFRTSPILALSEHRNLRFVTLFLLYLAQGLPFGLIDFALLAWLAQNGASAAAIGGVLAMVILPWTFKLPYGFMMDRYAFLAMGRRRPWIIIGQFGLATALVAMAIVNPDVHQISLIAAFAFAMGLASAVQDVAVDGLAVDILPEGEIERVNGYMFRGQAIGTAVGAAVSGTLIAYQGLPAAALVLAAIIAVILILVLVVRERPGERLLPWTQGEASQRNLDLHLGAFGPIIRNLCAAMFTRHTLILVPALIAITAAWGIFLGLAPLFAADILGWEKDIYSGWGSQAMLVSGLAGGLLFGLAAGLLGARRLFILGALLGTVTALGMLGLHAHWTNPVIMISAIFIFTLLTTLRAVTSGSLAMRLCTPSVAATQFAVFMAILNLGRTIASASLGWLDSMGGIPAMFTAMAILCLTAAAFAFSAKVEGVPAEQF
jgi:MFS transporter, PAT family, beta-lactamase induction signal transducer AmpG